jgi:hypothetical protein
MHRAPRSACDNHMVLSTGGQEQVRYGPAQQDQFGYIVQPYGKAMTGLVIYKVFPFSADPGRFSLVVREASSRRDLWPMYGSIALATSLSIRCIAALSLSGGGGGRADPDDRIESTYNAQLGMEYAHDPRTGENYWVSPAADYRNGPQGPGYYKSVGDTLIRLERGRTR